MRDRELPRMKDQFLLFPLTLQNTLLWLGLTAMAYAGNLANVTLSANLHYLFGTIPLLVILHFFGWGPALLTALIASFHTAILWGHPYGVVILMLEAVAVGLLYRRRSANLLLLDTGFWVLIGMPALFVVSRGLLGAAATSSLLTALRMGVNGIFNTLIASLIIAVLEQVIPRFRHEPSRRTLGFAQVIFLVMVAFVLIPTMAILVFTTRQEMNRVEQEVQTTLGITAFSARQAVNAWQAENFQTLRSLANFAGQTVPGNTGPLRTEMRLLNMSDADFTALVVTDTEGRVIAAEPESSVDRMLGDMDLGHQEYFLRMVSDLQGVVTNVIFKDDAGGTPVVLFGVPVGGSDSTAGAVIGILDPLRLMDLVARVSGAWAVAVTVVDGNGRIIVSTDRTVAPFTFYEDEYPGPYEQVSPGLSVRVPETRRGSPSTRSWPNAEYSTRERLGVTSGWTITLHAAIAPYQSNLNERYRSLFMVMILVTVITTLLSALVSRRMLGSLVQLATVAEGLPEKVTGQETPEWPVSNINEIHTLIQCFRLTSEHLATSFTQLQATNTELTEAKQDAEAANRTKSEFLANISHDLRTPLNGILGYAQILARDTSLDEQTRNAVSIIRKSGNHLLNLINDILDVSRIEADKMRLARSPFFLASFLDDIADIVSLQARQKGLRLVVDFADDLPPAVVGDEKRLRQVLLNLLNNAVKFTERGDVRFGARLQDDVLHVTVQDTGIGIPEDELEAIFSPFKQLTKHIQSEEGTGLGLAIVNRLVTMMDGDVSVESRPGVGSTFSVRVALPVTNAMPVAPQLSSTITGYTGTTRSVLVVDDKEQNRSVLRGMLEPLGFAVREATDGADGLRSLANEPADIILMDLVMPRMDGFEAIAEIRGNPAFSGLAVVAVSASVATTVRDECLRLGFSDFLPKPFRESDMLTMVGRLLDLEWVHRTDVSLPAGQQAAAPDLDELQALMEQAESGNIRGVVDAADELAARNESYGGFARSVTEMAQAFQINNLIDFLNGIREEQEARGEHDNE